MPYIMDEQQKATMRIAELDQLNKELGKLIDEGVALANQLATLEAANTDGAFDDVIVAVRRRADAVNSRCREMNEEYLLLAM